VYKIHSRGVTIMKDRKSGDTTTKTGLMSGVGLSSMHTVRMGKSSEGLRDQKCTNPSLHRSREGSGMERGEKREKTERGEGRW
jgi:hypothetical protein